MTSDWRRRETLLAGLALLSGCAATAPSPSKPGAAARPNRFYPPPPEVPRVQHLLTLSSERDLGPPRSGFADFIAGKDVKAMALAQPYGCGLHDGKLYVADTGAPGVAVFDLVARRMSVQAGAGAGRMRRPINITIDADGSKYVTDTAADRILVFDREMRFLRSIGQAEQFRPTDVAIAGERLYVVDILHHQVQVLDKRDGRTLFSFGKAGTGSGELFQPTNIAIGPGGDVFVVETGNFRVQRFTADGKPVRVYGEAGNLPGNFARPKGIAVDRGGRLYVGDSAFQNVQVFDAEGRLLMEFGRPMEGLDGLNLPAAVRLDYDHMPLFARYAEPNFVIEHLILVTSQFGPNKVDVYGFGRLAGKTDEAATTERKS